MTITMNDQAWVWMDWNRPYLYWIVDCPDCGQLEELPGDTFLRHHAEHLANVHNSLRHPMIKCRCLDCRYEDARH